MEGSHSESVSLKRRGDELEGNEPKKMNLERTSDLEKAIDGLNKIRELEQKIQKQEKLIQHLRSSI